MATAAPHEYEQHGQGHRTADNGTTARAPSPSATNGWGPYAGAGDFASNMAVMLAVLLAALALGLALNAAVRYVLRRRRRGRRAGAAAVDPEKALSMEVTPPPLALVYSAAGTKLAGAAECAICLAEFLDGDAVRVMPACGHGFHARCIERWLAGGRQSSCPTCRAPAATPQTDGGCRDCRVLIAGQ